MAWTGDAQAGLLRSWGGVNTELQGAGPPVLTARHWRASRPGGQATWQSRQARKLQWIKKQVCLRGGGRERVVRARPGGHNISIAVAISQRQPQPQPYSHTPTVTVTVAHAQLLPPPFFTSIASAWRHVLISARHGQMVNVSRVDRSVDVRSLSAILEAAVLRQFVASLITELECR